MRGLIGAGLGLLVTCGAAHARLALTLPLTSDATVTAARYRCDDGRDLAVRYVEAGANSLAIIPLEGEEVVFVNVVAASGARYVSGMWEWWAKGEEATLTRVDAAETTCRTVARQPN
ncbi:MliC family protein [Paracoccus indicus]|uniref:MliC family protein n=1 Tax=Paracoccus indicus TaxID=2079229 RepID=UPI000D365AAA|nr:MliC family protein [Paracoccus indicus]